MFRDPRIYIGYPAIYRRCTALKFRLPNNNFVRPINLFLWNCDGGYVVIQVGFCKDLMIATWASGKRKRVLGAPRNLGVFRITWHRKNFANRLVIVVFGSKQPESLRCQLPRQICPMIQAIMIAPIMSPWMRERSWPIWVMISCWVSPSPATTTVFMHHTHPTETNLNSTMTTLGK